MIVKACILKGKYLDSVKLMLISKELRVLPGIQDAVVIMATKENKEILRSVDMLVSEIETALETDIVAVVKADTDSVATDAIRRTGELVSSPPGSQSHSNGRQKATSIEKANQIVEKADLCLISIAGKYAAAEADKALDLGLHVMMFSDNVSLDDELRLKTKALEKGLLMMGPDCGTAIINGVPLAFANQVPRGNIGIISASGTGLQEICCGIANRGGGITQAIGTGGRDGKKEIGGLMLRAGLEFLINDPDTEVIVLMGKTPDPDILKLLMGMAVKTHKPVIMHFIKQIALPEHPNLQQGLSLDETALLACKASGNKLKDITQDDYPYPLKPTNRKYIRGLYSGGTLCQEALEIYKRIKGREAHSNIGAQLLKDGWKTCEDSFIDLGADEFTVGRPHPMIDYSLRNQKILLEAQKPDVAVILLDVVLGYGANPDPAAELVPVLKQISPELTVVCHVLGTDGDPQDKKAQITSLQKAGAMVFSSHAKACEYAINCLSERRAD